MTQVAIINSGGANITSLTGAFDRLGADTVLTTDADVIRAATHVLLPGVGAARDAMLRLRKANLVDMIPTLTQPVLGICLGLQLLCTHSAEDNVACLGVIPGTAQSLPVEDSHPVPNAGWCTTELTTSHPVLNGVEQGSYYYYVHSYALPVSDHTIATATHASPFSAMLSKDNFITAQFHPERSSQAGARILCNFLEWEG